MTYNVFGGTLNPTLLLYQPVGMVENLATGRHSVIFGSGHFSTWSIFFSG